LVSAWRCSGPWRGSSQIAVSARGLSQAATHIRVAASSIHGKRARCSSSQKTRQPTSSNLKVVSLGPPRSWAAKRWSAMRMLQRTQASRSQAIGFIPSGQSSLVQPARLAASGVSSRPATPSWPMKRRL